MVSDDARVRVRVKCRDNRLDWILVLSKKEIL